MSKIVECVPNISEGRRMEIIDEIVFAVKQVPGVTVLDCSSNSAHNRTVISIIGDPERVLEATWHLIVKAAELIDMDEHCGAHPRIGAVDVVPFVPVRDVSMEECVVLARRLGERVGSELNIPVYLYGEAASRPERRNLADVRRGGYELLKDDVAKPFRQPDYGPSVLDKAGAVAVGARPPLVAYNVNLGTTRVEVAHAIARSVRGSSGGFVNVKAIGLNLPEQGMVQISMNMVDTVATPLNRVWEFIRNEAARYGVPVVESEIVGLVPLDALLDVAISYLGLHRFSKDQILEKRIFDF